MPAPRNFATGRRFLLEAGVKAPLAGSSAHSTRRPSSCGSTTTASKLARLLRPLRSSDNTHEVSIGARKNANSSNYELNLDSNVDEVAIYDRAAEITAHYQAAFASADGSRPAALDRATQLAVGTFSDFERASRIRVWP